MTDGGSARKHRATKRVTIEDVAARAGVSRALVSIVLRDVPGASPENRRRVLSAVEALGYRPDARAQRLRQKRSAVIGVVFSVQEPFHCDLVEAIYRAASSEGCEVLLSAVTQDRDDARAIDTLMADRCDAAILVAPRLPADARPIRDLVSRMHTVVIGPHDPIDGIDIIRQDNTFGMRLAVEHLQSLGHTHIAHIDGGDEVLTSRLRRAGFVTATEDLGLDSGSVFSGGLTEDDGARAVTGLLDQKQVTAVVTFNDRVALGLRDALLQAGRRVPVDLSLVGYDDSRPARAEHISLTTVAQPTEEIARRATSRAAHRINGTVAATECSTVRPTLTVRRTTAAPGR